jgi:UDP-glucose 4-epimerase
MKNHKILVTGGAGFIGSHLTERLLKEQNLVTILDNFSGGSYDNIRHLLSHPLLKVVEDDLKHPIHLEETVENNELVFHAAANPEVRIGETSPETHFRENVQATFHLLEALRKTGKQKTIIFTSTSTVYGEAAQIPTPEDYAPLIPISTYGASKLAAEALITSHAHTSNNRALILRLANIVGPRSNHGVIADFVKKIQANPKQLEILGDGTQEKSYLHIEDLINATIHLTDLFLENTEKTSIYNIGPTDKITVKEIANIVTETMHTHHTEYVYTGGVDGGRGWKGDVKIMQLSIEKLLQTGWKPKYTSKQAVMLAAKALASARGFG